MRRRFVGPFIAFDFSGTTAQCLSTAIDTVHLHGDNSDTHESSVVRHMFIPSHSNPLHTLIQVSSSMFSRTFLQSERTGHPIMARCHPLSLYDVLLGFLMAMFAHRCRENL